MKTYFPDQLAQREHDTPLDHAMIDIGDIVTVRLADGQPIASTVIFNTPFLGITTYTADAELPAANGAGPQRIRLRFRARDIHRVEHARDRRCAA